MTDYLITSEPGEHHDLRVMWANNRALLYVSTNSRTFGLSSAMAKELIKALMACVHGPFDRAITETSLLLEQQEVHLRDARIPSANIKPELDQL